MKKVLTVLSLMAFLLTASPALAAVCFNCGSGSSNGCKQCRSRSGKDTFKDRKICKKIGCKITGTGSCSTAANVKVCSIKTNLPRAASTVHFPLLTLR